MIEILKNFPDNVIALSCEGQVTKEDYEGILVPAILKRSSGTTRSGSSTRSLRISPATTQALSGKT